MKDYTAMYFYRDDNGKLETTNAHIAAASLTEARRIAKARVGGKTTMRLVSVLPSNIAKDPDLIP